MKARRLTEDDDELITSSILCADGSIVEFCTRHGAEHIQMRVGREIVKMSPSDVDWLIKSVVALVEAKKGVKR